MTKLKNAHLISSKYYLTNQVKPESSIKAAIKAVPANNDPTFIKVAKFTPIKLSLQDSLSSDMNKTNDTISLQVSEDVVINDKVCIVKGTLAKGLFWKVVPAQGYGVPGFIDIIIPEIQITLRLFLISVITNSTVEPLNFMSPIQ